MYRAGLLIAALLLCIAAIILAIDSYALLYSPMSISAENARISVNKSISAATLVKTLNNRGWICSPRLLLAFIRLNGLAHKLKAGVYQISKGESALQFLYRVAAGDVLMGSFSIIDGMNQVQISQALAATANIVYKPTDWLSIKALHLNAEGLLLADTYNYAVGSSAKALLELAHSKLNEYLQLSWQQRSSGMPYKTPYELLIVASIIEKESANPAERRLIAGVIINRLHKNMPLQMDPTVIYALGANYKPPLLRENLHIDSPYNTYRYRGLPPTPIAMVGKAALAAAAHPEFNNYLYFVAIGNGSHYFSVNYTEQQQAVARYRAVK